MRVINSFLPIIILLIAAFYGFQKYDQLPVSASIGFTYLTYMLAAIIAGLSIRFGRGSIFFQVLLVVVANLGLRLDWAEGELSYGLLSVFVPLLLVTLTMLPDRGILSLKAIPAYVILLLAGMFSIALATTSPAWAMQAILTDWLPPHYFDWTRQSQTVLGISFAALYVMLTRGILNPGFYAAAGFGILLMLVVQLHHGGQERSLDVFSAAALLMGLYAIMQETWRLAYLDELTGLPGRRALSEKFQKVSGTYTVAMLDVDHFKRFNDNFGHDAGDAVLRMVAAKMGKVTGGGLSYRYGGEEFAIVFTGKTSADSVRHLEALREEIANKAFVIRRVGRRRSDNTAPSSTNNTVHITVSIGFADSSKKNAPPWEVLKLADKALYRAKGKGRNCISE